MEIVRSAGAQNEKLWEQQRYRLPRSAARRISVRHGSCGGTAGVVVARSIIKSNSEACSCPNPARSSKPSRGARLRAGLPVLTVTGGSYRASESSSPGVRRNLRCAGGTERRWRWRAPAADGCWPTAEASRRRRSSHLAHGRTPSPSRRAARPRGRGRAEPLLGQLEAGVAAAHRRRVGCDTIRSGAPSRSCPSRMTG